MLCSKNLRNSIFFESIITAVVRRVGVYHIKYTFYIDHFAHSFNYCQNIWIGHNKKIKYFDIQLPKAYSKYSSFWFWINKKKKTISMKKSNISGSRYIDIKSFKVELLIKC